LEDINLFASDVALQEAMTREGAGHASKRLAGFGLMAGSADAAELGRLANEQFPRLMTHDRNGNRISRVDVHPAYHDLMGMSVAEGLQASAWMQAATPGVSARQGVYVERAGCLYMAAQADAGHLRSISMTHSAVPALSHHAQITAKWVPKITSRSYDRRLDTVAGKTSLTLGFAFAGQLGANTEAVTTQARPLSDEGDGKLYALSGVVPSVAAPLSDGLLVLAHTAGAASTGPSCFLVPRRLPSDQANTLFIRRLIRRVGLRSCVCADIELDAAQAWLLGEEGQGLEVVSESILHARLDTVIVSAGLMRQCLIQAVHVAEHRMEGGAPSISQPIVHQTLADMALDAEVAGALGFRLARAFDRSSDARAAAWRHLMTPVSVYWVSRRAPMFAAEAIDVLGREGCSQDWPLARLYCDCPVAAMADGTANMMVHGVMRILQREPGIAETVMEELGQAAGDDAHLRAAHVRIEAMLHDPRHLDARGRLLVEALAVLAAGTILRTHGPSAVADAFIKSRMGNQPLQSYGQGLEWADTAMIVRRASPNHA
ncbi:MAG: acyl-CoA dehydrogenase family protein, partial [Hyphomicrobium sp.]